MAQEQHIYTRNKGFLVFQALKIECRRLIVRELNTITSPHNDKKICESLHEMMPHA